MIGENEHQELQRLKSSTIFTESEVELIDFIIQEGRTPNYVDEKNKYQILLRLKRKLKQANEKQLILSNLFQTLDNLKVSSKLVGGGVD